MRAVRGAYLASDPTSLRVLDVGSGAEPGMLTYRDLFPGPAFEYVGLDLEPGHNVDLVPGDPFAWPEIPTDHFDAVISGQTFEHCPYPWITTAEIARVLRPGGLLAVIAPSKGMVHRYPLDCWRFYPDSWAALCAYVGLELVEEFTEPTSWRLLIPGVYWGDSVGVARKPMLAEGDESAAFHKRLEAIMATRTDMPAPSVGVGEAGARYAKTHVLATSAMAAHPAFVMHRLNPHLSKRWPLNRLKRAAVRANGRRALARGAMKG